MANECAKDGKRNGKFRERIWEGIGKIGMEVGPVEMEGKRLDGWNMRSC
jgi:hypothetical protein